MPIGLSTLFFNHNLCFKCPNGSCEPILDIYILRAFQWYKEFFNLMGLVPCNYSLKIQKSIETWTLKVGAHLGVWGFIPSHSPTLSRTWDVIPKLPSWPAPLQTFALVTSPKLRLWHTPLLSYNEAHQNLKGHIILNLPLMHCLQLLQPMSFHLYHLSRQFQLVGLWTIFFLFSYLFMQQSFLGWFFM